MCLSRYAARRLAIVVAVLAAALSALPAQQGATPAFFHVAPDGNDQNPGTREKPFATLTRARDAIRAVRRQQGGTLAQPATVLVHGGTHSLTTPLVLTQEDSGTAAAPVIYTAGPGAKPVLSGGRRVTGWKEAMVDGKRLWVAELPDVRTGRWYFHQLWVNGQRRQRARHPNAGFLKIAALPGVDAKTPRTQGQDRFQFAPGEIKTWEGLANVDVIALHLWVSVRLPIATVNEREHLVTFASKSRRRLMDGNEPARYCVENAFELLDSAGEWYLQRGTGKLYYAPLPNENMATAEVIAPVLPQLLLLQGNGETGKRLEHVAFRGLAFQHAEWWPPRNDPCDVQAAASVPAVIQGDGLEQCAFEDCSVAHVSGYGIHLAGACKQNRIVRCALFDLGAGGIRVGETALRADAALQTSRNTVTDNHIHDAGQIFHQAVGVWIGQSAGNQVAHNHIHDLYYTGISCGWTWGYGKSLARDNVIEFNHVHDLGKGWLSDMGGIYTLGMQPGTIIRSNVFHDIAGYNYGGWGIYFDEGSTAIVAENNLVYRTTHGGFHQHYGRDNVVRNNVFALGRDAQLRRTRVEPHLSFTLERNLVYYRTGELLNGKWDDDQVKLDRNVYWCVNGPVRFGGRTAEEWRARGQDQHSVIADPLFVDADKADFRLRADSPATRVGFRMPDWTGVGPRSAARGPGGAVD